MTLNRLLIAHYSLGIFSTSTNAADVQQTVHDKEIKVAGTIDMVGIKTFYSQSRSYRATRAMPQLVALAVIYPYNLYNINYRLPTTLVASV